MVRVLLSITMALLFGAWNNAVADGVTVFKAKCQQCHGADGKGSSLAPPLQGNQFINSSTADDISKVILNGRKGADKKYKQYSISMPAQKLSPDETKDVISYLKSL